MNGLLAAIEQSEQQLVAELFEPAAFALGDVLWQPGDLFSRVYFPTAGILSAVVVMGDGGTIEGWLTGREGAAGLEAAFGLPRAAWRMTAQADGAALTIAPANLRALLHDLPAFTDMLLRYSHAVQKQATQSLACNRFHPIAERLARWLLMTSDRQDHQVQVQVTHEFMAQMLGAHRPSVTISIATLERAGLIRRVSRGRIDILDRAGLEEASCECYRAAEVER